MEPGRVKSRSTAADYRSDAEVLTAAMNWFEDHEPVRDWRWMFEYNRANEVSRACILGALFVVVGSGKPPDSLCDVIYRARRELFPDRTLSELFTKREIRALYRWAIALAARTPPQAGRPARLLSIGASSRRSWGERRYPANRIDPWGLSLSAPSRTGVAAGAKLTRVAD
jgi:hypothetical protein